MRARSPFLALTAVGLFLGFLVYFLLTSWYLPAGAGPDYPYSQKAVTYYLQHQRLPVMPEDAELVAFSQFGDSRALRPPLGFATAALLAHFSPALESNWRYAYRHASALFGALTVMLVFLAIWTYFYQYWMALCASVAFGLLPQFSFTASYLNDDSSAIFSAVLLFYSMLLLYRQKADYSLFGLGFFGFSVGIVIISKITAWLLLPAAFLFYLLFVFRFNKQGFKSVFWVGLGFVLGGGWWCCWNMWHYGFSDPFLLKLTAQLKLQYARVDLQQLGFAVRGIGFYDLLLFNSHDFLGATYKAVIGHLDWLRLRMSAVQYNYYYLFLVSAFAYILFRIVQTVLIIYKTKLLKLDWVKLGFELVIACMLVVQMLVYTWHNIHNDIQIQGKYLLPVVLPILLLAMSFFIEITRTLKAYSLYNKTLAQCVAGLMIIAPVLVHWHGLVKLVIPFYWPSK